MKSIHLRNRSSNLPAGLQDATINHGILFLDPSIAPWLTSLSFSAQFASMRTNVPEGLWLEFGTATGSTAKTIADHLSPDKKLYTFDCFTGLPEDWGLHKAGHFAQTPPELDKNKIQIIEGLFKDSLPTFLVEHEEKICFIHIDCDLYSSTKTVLELLKDRIVRGTIIAFDEYFDHNSLTEDFNDPQPRAITENGESKAFLEFAEQNNIKYQFICSSLNHSATCIIL